MKTKKYLVPLLFAVLFLSFSSDSSSDTTLDIPPVITHYPITQEYFQGLIDLEEEFSSIELVYYMRKDTAHPDARQQKLVLFSRFIRDHEGNILNLNLSTVETYHTFYRDNDEQQTYIFDIPSELVIPMFHLIQQNGDYLFNAEEFNGEESLVYAYFHELGITNNVRLEIKPPDRIKFVFPDIKMFVKGWEIGEDPPEELMPLIDYLEEVIIPIVRQHPR